MIIMIAFVCHIRSMIVEFLFICVSDPVQERHRSPSPFPRRKGALKCERREPKTAEGEKAQKWWRGRRKKEKVEEKYLYLPAADDIGWPNDKCVPARGAAGRRQGTVGRRGKGWMAVAAAEEQATGTGKGRTVNTRSI